MINSQLGTILERYKTEIERLKVTDTSIDAEQVLEVLNARDAVQLALKGATFIPTSRLKQVLELDTELRKQAIQINKVIKAEQFAQWRESIHPPGEAWWWRLENLTPPHKWDRFDWLWKGLVVAGWTANLSLLINIATRFLSGGAGLLGASAVILPSILALLQASSELTKAGKEGFEKLLTKLNIPQHLQEEAKLGSTLLMTGFLLSFWLALPSISQLYNRNGLNNYQQGKLGAAEQDYLKAISLDADNADAHYNLGNLYEDLQDFEKARKHYQIAVGSDVPDAYNNLARLYIQDKKYSQARALLQNGLVKAKDLPEVRYSLFKNLGWVRFEEGRYEEAQLNLQAAIGIANNPEVAKNIQNTGAAYCILAQVMERQKQPAALEQWQKCCEQGSTLNADEDTWLHLARQKLQKAGRVCK
ncbi:tetratricopeptide repeat protein [Calothrix sp. FACHB-1219]|uniref:tetratricopeptide repeat protein n=1 Tax=Calothrix sp. FACHB-1219 TaxID=2692778 RepID=UPI0016881FAB|nr:tetratricopeptide repeat protein [Calothrix sp. FACHB-1219]MBD2221140.1 tetratricopeptide repeat protein [Calothrix sp. FACHB-1219]